MGRKFTRKMKGGDVDIKVVKSTIDKLKNDVSTITADIQELGKNLGLNGSAEVLNEEVEVKSQQSKLQDKAKQVVNDFDEELVNYVTLMKSIIESGIPIKKEDKDFLIENMNKNKTLFEDVGITEDLLNTVQIDEEVSNKSAESVNTVQIVNNEEVANKSAENIDNSQTTKENEYNMLKEEIIRDIKIKKEIFKEKCNNNLFNTDNKKTCTDIRRGNNNMFENWLNTISNADKEKDINIKLAKLEGLNKNYSGYIAKNKSKFQGGRKTKKNQKKSRKSRRHNKSRK
jgi:hypothetical protein